MASKEADGVITRAPYTLSFDEDFSGPYDEGTRTAKFDEELSDRAPESNGPGTADVTLKDRLAAFGDLANGLSAMVQALTGTDPSAQARQQQAAEDPNMQLSPDLHHAVVTLPDPKHQDSAYFRLAFPVNLKKQDDTHVTGTDEIGTFDYVVRVTARPPQ